MNNSTIIEQRLKESIEVKQSLLTNKFLINTISDLADTIAECIKSDGKIIICGNGGSASDALHFAGEIVGRFVKERRAWPAVVLNADVATMTAISNDYGYDEVFARQAEAHVKPGDVFFGISTSGNSENVYRAMQKSHEIGAVTCCLAGKIGGRISKIADYSIVVPSNVTARIQECHICIIHILCELVERKLANDEDC